MDNCSWAKLFHRSGLQVTVALGSDIKTLAESIDYLLGVGFLVDAPGFEPGEERQEVGFVVRTQHEDDNGTVTPVIMLYSGHEKMVYTFLRVYLNTPDQVAAFEAASGMKLTAIPLYEGAGNPERGKSKATDKFIIPVRRHMEVVIKPNAKYSAEDCAALKASNPQAVYKVPKKMFVRWHDAPSAPADSNQPSVYEKAKAAIMAVEALSSNAGIDWGLKLETHRDNGALTPEQFEELAKLLTSKTEGLI